MKKVIVGQVVRFTFEDGVAPYELDCTKLTAPIKEHAVPFAMAHRLGDNAAIARKDPKTGAIVNVTEAMRRDAVAEIGDYLAGGATDWNMKQSVRVPAVNQAVVKMAARLGITYEEAIVRDVDDMLNDIMAKSA